MAYEISCSDGRVVSSDSLGGAIKAACDLITRGVTVSKLKGSDGFTMERSDIETEHLRRLMVSRQVSAKARSREPVGIGL